MSELSREAEGILGRPICQELFLQRAWYAGPSWGFINALIVEFLAGGGVEREDSANSAMHYVLQMSSHYCFTDSVCCCAKGGIHYHIYLLAAYYLRVFQLVPHAPNI